MQNIDETSSILDVLKLGSYYYGFMAKEIIKKYPEITDKELLKDIGIRAVGEGHRSLGTGEGSHRECTKFWNH